MKDSEYISKLREQYENVFPLDWIDKLDWKDEVSSKSSYMSGKKTVDDFECFFFVNISNSVLSGDFLLKSYDTILQTLVASCEHEAKLDEGNELKNRLAKSFIELNQYICDILNLYRLKIQGLYEKLQISNNDYIINAISTRSHTFSNSIFKALEIILFFVFDEYYFSYRDEYIQTLILQKDELSKIKDKLSNTTAIDIINAVCIKIDMLLTKLSHYSKQKIIQYRLDFKEQKVQYEETTNSSIFEESKYFHYFNDPSIIPNSEIRSWQIASSQKKATIKQMVMLMRYYSNVNNECTIQQIDNLLSQFEDFESRIQKSGKITRIFDDYALRTVKNYMYNCRLNFLLNKSKTFDEIYQEVLKIINIQRTTGINNYYPFHKALKCLSVIIKDEIKSNNDVNQIKEHKKHFDDLLEKLEMSFEWCKKNQFYPFQLWYNECITELTDKNVKIFSPSSFCKPVKYNELKDEINRIKIESITIDGEIQMYEKELKINTIKKQLEHNKKTYIEILGVFTAIVTFLVSCITIFTNSETPQVSIYEKIEHISMMGIIVLLFINGGYFLLSEIKCKSFKFWFFLLTTLLYLTVIVKTYLFH